MSIFFANVDETRTIGFPEELVSQHKETSRNNDETASAVSHAAQLSSLLRRGNKNVRRDRMVRELHEHACQRDADALGASLVVCSDASLGDDAAHSDTIRTAASDFHGAVTTNPPRDFEEWDALRGVFQPDAITVIDSAAECSTATDRANDVVCQQQLSLHAIQPASAAATPTEDDPGSGCLH